MTNNIMGKPMKHYGVDKNTHARYFILALESDQDKDLTTVVDMDSLDSDMRAELDEFIKSDECQRTQNPWKLMESKFFLTNGTYSMMDVLRKLRKVRMVSNEEVLVLLPDNKTMSAKDVLAGIREYNEKRKENVKNIGASTELQLETSKSIDDLTERVNKMESSIEQILSLLKTSKK